MLVPDFYQDGSKAYVGGDILPSPAVLADVELLAAATACNSKPSCQAFNSDITLKGGSSVSGPSASKGGCLYIRQGMIKIQPDDNSTCLTNSPQSLCEQCAQVSVLPDRVACYRCLSSQVPSSQCFAAVMDGRLLNYTARTQGDARTGEGSVGSSFYSAIG